MNYIGLEDIEVRDMSSTYEDSNVCRYAIGHRDVVYSLGRTQNVVRNVIAISIGDIEAKAAELYANFDGHGGREGSNTEYHHIGFDIVANRILETLERYASRYDPRYQKIYWITGEAGGGSVANLLAQKMIKKYGNQNIYCYTFQALNTINCNNIPAVQRISNEPYGSIFNLYNDDNELIKLYSNDNNFYKYGINKHVAVSSSDEYIGLWQNATGEKYNLTTKNNNAERFKEWLSESEDGVVSGFSNTNLANIFVNVIRETIIKFTAFFKSIGRVHISTSNVYENPIEQEIYDNASKIVSASSDIFYIQSGGEISGIIDAIGTAQDRKVDSVNPNAYIDDDNDPRNGYRFVNFDNEDLNYNKLNLDTITANTENVHTIKVNNSNYVYSNYTMTDDEVFCDIDFTKFWNITAEEQSNINNVKRYFESKASSSNAAHMHLFDIKAGDFGEKYDDNQKSGKTLATYGSCFGKDRINNVINELEYTDIFDAVKNSNKVVAFDKDIKKDNGTVGKFLTIDGRIVAAFPFAALVREISDSYKNVGRNMHMFNKYYHPETEYEGAYYGKSANDGKESIYRYVDVVFEKDGNKKHQYVVPFIIIDAKAIHYRPNAEGFFGTFVDNRYGQVYQKKDDLKSRDDTGKIKNEKVENPMVLYYDGNKYRYLTKDDAVIMDLVIANKDPNYASWKKIEDANYLEYYPDKDEVREINRISPIEPYVSNKDENEVVLSEKIGNVAVTSSLLLTPKDKIISMRVYKHKFDKNDQRHFLNIREDRSKIEPDDTDDRKKVLNETEQNVVRNVIINYSQ